MLRLRSTVSDSIFVQAKCFLINEAKKGVPQNASGLIPEDSNLGLVCCNCSPTRFLHFDQYFFQEILWYLSLFRRN